MKKNRISCSITAGGSILNKNAPEILVFAGPNGSGKSTVTAGFDVIGEYINADDIKRNKQCTDLEAAQIATELREWFLDKGQSFTFETVLSSDRNIELLEKAKKKGFRIFAVFVLTSDVEINVARVRDRVRKGGHDVPEEKIRTRYYKSLNNVSRLASIVDVMKVIDNSGDTAKLIIDIENGFVSFYENNVWTFEKLHKLI